MWIYACRRRDLPYWLDDELWRIELEAPVREARYQIASPRARLLSRVADWDRGLMRDYAQACALRARDLALPHVPGTVREALTGATDLEAIAVAAASAGPTSRAAEYVADAANNALHVGPATTSYIAAMLASSLGGGLAAFEAERAWQAGWIAERLALEPIRARDRDRTPGSRLRRAARPGFERDRRRSTIRLRARPNRPLRIVGKHARRVVAHLGRDAALLLGAGRSLGRLHLRVVLLRGLIVALQDGAAGVLP